MRRETWVVVIQTVIAVVLGLLVGRWLTGCCEVPCDGPGKACCDSMTDAAPPDLVCVGDDGVVVACPPGDGRCAYWECAVGGTCCPQEFPVACAYQVCGASAAGACGDTTCAP